MGETKRKMIYNDPIQKKDVLTVRRVLADHRYRYLQSLVLYNYNKMETRFLVSALFILLSGVMFWAVADEAEQQAGTCTVAAQKGELKKGFQDRDLGFKTEALGKI